MSTLNSRAFAAALSFCVLVPSSCHAEPAAVAAATLIGFAFVDASVTGQGSRAVLPDGVKIYPPGSTIGGSEGCPTNRYRTDGLLVAVIDYSGRPTAASLTVTRSPETGGRFVGAPYYLDLDTGRKLQFLGPIFDNGAYEIDVSYDFAAGAPKPISGRFVLARTCPPTE